MTNSGAQSLSGSFGSQLTKRDVVASAIVKSSAPRAAREDATHLSRCRMIIGKAVSLHRVRRGRARDSPDPWRFLLEAAHT
jgi:hypothetical protein